MRRASILPVIIILAVVIGGTLYLYGGAAFHPSMPAPSSSQETSAPSATQTQSGGDVVVLAQGQNAAGVNERVNYRIADAGQLNTLWQMVYTNNGPVVPDIDFSRKEVLALFDGSHSTGGYGIRLDGVHDKDGVRTINITHIEPGDSCVPAAGITSPFVIVEVPKTPLPLSHDEVTQITQCE